MLMAAAVTLITGWVKTHALTSINGTWTQLLSWAISIGLAFVGSQKGLGVFANTTVIGTVLNGIGVGLIANGIFSADFVQTILAFLKAKKSA